MSDPEITHRDLESRSREILDVVQTGQTFIVTRDGHEIDQLVPSHRRRRFVSRDEFAAMPRTTADMDLAVFRADQDATAEAYADDPYNR
ncbi:type II toxin-antitoxin system Phd/YefM family antitoxin [Nocardia carnea]|uniref:type II toxin-antitoxin system Phd/YefM family antitoxin n=1 Tax=Nocardia carnea TaxID=37328 RepID=UPI0024590FB6|nr:prevent-host-death protein [Nocardia carnea]